MLTKVVSTPERIVRNVPPADAHTPSDRPPAPVRPEPFLRAPTIEHHVAGKLQSISDFSQAMLDTAVLHARNKERWVVALEQSVQGKADQDTIDIGNIRFSSIAGSTLAAHVQRGRNALVALAISRADTGLSRVSAAERTFGKLTQNVLNPLAGLEQPLLNGQEWLSKRGFFHLGQPVGEARATWKARLEDQLGAQPIEVQRPRKMRRPSIDNEHVAPREPAHLPAIKPAEAAVATTPLEQSRQAIERALPIARRRLDGALSAVSDPVFEKDLKFVCNTFFGSDSEAAVAAFTRKQRTMKVDLDTLNLSNINFLENEGAQWQAQLLPTSYSRYKAGNLQEKYIEVNVEGATDYYHFMGNSDEAMANTLIHEQAHGFPGDEDYVYSGAIKGGREDIAGLLNLGKTTDPTHFRHLGDEVQEATLSLFAKTPQAHNADSTLFGIALLDQAKNNRTLYEENVAAIQQALATAKANGGVITEHLPVRIIRKRATPRQSFAAVCAAAPRSDRRNRPGA